MRYTLAQVKDGTGFAPDAEFVSRDIYIAEYYDSASRPFSIGVYSDEDRARAGCQEHYAEEASYRLPRLTEPLEWNGDEATDYLDGGRYKVVMAELDRRIGL